MFEGVSSLLMPHGFFFGTMTDAGQLWTFAQKEIELREILRAREMAVMSSELALLASSSSPRGGSIYVQKKLFNLVFPEGEEFQRFGSRYRIDFPLDEDGSEESIQTNLVHSSSLIQIARQVQFACLDIMNYVEFWEDFRKHFHRIAERLGVLHTSEATEVDVVLRKPFDKDEMEAMSLFSAFMFVKCD
uniref:mRNA (guanine-N(7))-methyltransferase n=1 Tax=Compsopogon caeruleus TaxID=31354 RepID=A0A7S1T8T0_9RHOD|mmetsp:Transcript_12781/g.25931  ORF Transcript_12781/g.25931 Transcript_12781/m.25931 type:complete len:189 (+) Transcript_12781:258-824(+)